MQIRRKSVQGPLSRLCADGEGQTGAIFLGNPLSQGLYYNLYWRSRLEAAKTHSFAVSSGRHTLHWATLHASMHTMYVKECGVMRWALARIQTDTLQWNRLPLARTYTNAIFEYLLVLLASTKDAKCIQLGVAVYGARSWFEIEQVGPFLCAFLWPPHRVQMQIHSQTHTHTHSKYEEVCETTR